MSRDSRADASPPAHGTIDDVGITAAIHARLIADHELKSRRIDIDTRDGHVLLQGVYPQACTHSSGHTSVADLPAMLYCMSLREKASETPVITIYCSNI